MKNLSKNLKHVAMIIACFAVCMMLAMTGCKKDDNNGGGDAPLTGIKFDKKSVTIKVGESATLKLVPIPSDATLPKCDFESDDESIATVNSSGKVTAKAEGETTITATTKDGKFNAECTVKVTQNGGGGGVTLTGIKFDKDNLTVEVGESTTVKIIPIPADAELPKFTVISEDMDIASYLNGIVSGLSKGETKLKALTNDGKFSAECKVTVTQSGTGEIIYRDPYLIFGADTTAVKAYETRELQYSSESFLWYKGENDDVKTVIYSFDEKKLSSATVSVFNKTNIEKRLVAFLSSKYKLSFKYDNSYMFESYDGKLWIDLSYSTILDTWEVRYSESEDLGNAKYFNRTVHPKPYK